MGGESGPWQGASKRCWQTIRPSDSVGHILTSQIGPFRQLEIEHRGEGHRARVYDWLCPVGFDKTP